MWGTKLNPGGENFIESFGPSDPKHRESVTRLASTFSGGLQEITEQNNVRSLNAPCKISLDG